MSWDLELISVCDFKRMWLRSNDVRGDVASQIESCLNYLVNAKNFTATLAFRLSVFFINKLTKNVQWRLDISLPRGYSRNQLNFLSVQSLLKRNWRKNLRSLNSKWKKIAKANTILAQSDIFSFGDLSKFESNKVILEWSFRVHPSGWVC